MIGILQVLLDGLSQGSTNAVLAVGVAVVGSVMSFPNFAHGWLVMWVAAFTVILPSLFPITSAFVIGTIVVVSASVLSGRLILLWGKSAAGEILLLKSLAFGLALQSLAIITFGDGPRLFPAPDWFGQVVSFGQLRLGLSSVASLLVALVAVAGVMLMINRTDLGLMMRAVSQSESAAALAGIRIRHVVNTALVIAGVMAAIAAFLHYAKAGSVMARSGMDITMTAFVAVVIGGLRSVNGALLGGLALGIVNAMLTTYLPAELQGYTRGLTYALLIGVLVSRPEGLLQRRR